eukprot:CAMPEP_0198228870 /NCGR_PEP_ID=MMETSP1445-20131203/113827_1 /TAXON_ID=36898 /ORGANISM="Pyramimonas sp., Strain CCMP2087" /LENGTH=580 /DNA_ID=CAMNT_0043909303 /DNA_START=198 /DNA_END=1941 /DNA_ORIENTATION=+
MSGTTSSHKKRQRTNNKVSTLAGTGEADHRDGEQTVARFNRPCGVAVDGSGNVFVADFLNPRIRKITPQGHVSTLAGTGEEGYQDGGGTVAQFNSPRGIAVDGDGNVFVADMMNNRIRKITPQGHVSTLAGTGEEGYQDGEAIVAQFKGPGGLAVDGDGNVFVVDTGERIRKITPQGIVSTLAGTGVQGYQDGEGTVSQFNKPRGLAVDGDGNVFVADMMNNRIRKITPQGHVSTLAGTGVQGYQDGEGTVSQFNKPQRTNNTVSTLAGTTGVQGYQDGEGTVVAAQFKPHGVAGAWGWKGNVIVADMKNHHIRKITPQGHVSTLAGTGVSGRQDGDRVTSAQFRRPVGVVVDEDGNVLVADAMNHCIRCVASDAATPLGFLRLPPLPRSSFVSDIQHHLIDSGSFHDVTFVVDQERVPAHRSHLSARCKYFRSMFSAGFQEGGIAEIHIEGTSSAAFKALLKYLYTDNMDEAVDDAVLFDLAKLSDQYQVERLHTHCLHRLFKGITIQNAVVRLVQAHTASGEGPTPDMCARLQSTTLRYVTHNLEEMRCNAMETLELLEREHPDLFKKVLKRKCGFDE